MKGKGALVCGKVFRKRFSEMVRFGKRLSSWWTKAMPAAPGVVWVFRGVGFAADAHGAGGGQQVAAENVHEGGFAGAVLTDEPEDGCGLDAETDALEDLDAEERFVDAFEFDGGSLLRVVIHSAEANCVRSGPIKRRGG